MILKKLASLSILISLSVISLIGCGNNKDMVKVEPTPQNIIIYTQQPLPTPISTPDNNLVIDQKSSWKPLMMRTNEFGKPEYQTKEAKDREDKEMMEQIENGLMRLGE